MRQQQRRVKDFRRRRTLRDTQLRAQIETTQAQVDAAIAKHGHTMDAFLDRRFASVRGQTATSIEHQAVRWKPSRQQVHKSIFDDVLKKAQGVPTDREAVIMGGLPGAGKTTTVRGSLDLSRYVNLNPDDFKELLLLRGYADEATQLLYDQGKITLSRAIGSVEIPGTGLKGLEAAALLHEESSWLYKEFSRRFVQTGQNVVLDVTMGSAKSIAPQIERLRASGYSVKVLFVDVDVSTTMSRAIARWQRSGRFVPPSYIESLADPTWGSRNRATFEALKDRADSWALFDNNFRPIELASG